MFFNLPTLLTWGRIVAILTHRTGDARSGDLMAARLPDDSPWPLFELRGDDWAPIEIVPSSLNASTTALPSGRPPTRTGNRTPRTSENTPNHEATTAAAWSDVRSGPFENTTGSCHARCPVGSTNGIGSSDRSFGSGSFEPAMASVLLASIAIAGG